MVDCPPYSGFDRQGTTWVMDLSPQLQANGMSGGRTSVLETLNVDGVVVSYNDVTTLSSGDETELWGTDTFLCSDEGLHILRSAYTSESRGSGEPLQRAIEVVYDDAPLVLLPDLQAGDHWQTEWSGTQFTTEDGVEYENPMDGEWSFSVHPAPDVSVPAGAFPVLEIERADRGYVDINEDAGFVALDNTHVLAEWTP